LCGFTTTSEPILAKIPEKIQFAPPRRRAGNRHGGGAASFGVLLKVGLSKVQNFPQDSTFAFLGKDCLAASPLGMGASRLCTQQLLWIDTQELMNFQVSKLLTSKRF